VNPGAFNVYWFVLPLALSVSLVYAASRHESWRRIWRHAAGLCAKILGAMAVVTVLLLYLHGWK
jgi:hypothetical protein